jgi:ABC-2 type transport system permease protein
MSKLLALWAARNREYYRDKGSLFWSFLFTPLLVVILALSFSEDDQHIFTLGIHQSDESREFLFIDKDSDLTYADVIDYPILNDGLKRLKYHQLDLLLNNDTKQYWVNEKSTRSDIMERLLLNDLKGWERQTTTGRQIRYIDWVIPGMLAMNLMFSGLFGVGFVIVRYRKNGVLKRLQAAPIKAWEFLAAQGLSRLSIMLTVTTLLFVVCKTLVGMQVDGSYWLLFFIALLGNLSIISMALFISSRSASEEFTNGLLNAVSFPMLLLSEIWFSLDKAPIWLQYIADLSPLTHMVRAARLVILEGATVTDIAVELSILLAMTLLFLFLAAKLFRWYKE